MRGFKLCSIDGCERQAQARGYCFLHYRRHLNNSDMLKPVKGTPRKCTIENCERPVLASGLCNAHYVRRRNNKDMSVPVWERKIVCIECGKRISHGGQGRCTKHYRKWLYKTRMEKLTQLLGGKCSECGVSYPFHVYDFHHVGEKSFGISNNLTNKSEEELIKEASKCVLLCANCHREEHYGIRHNNQIYPVMGRVVLI